MQSDCAIILAAGEGQRMGADVPKVLCEVLFKPMIGWVIGACKDSQIEDRCVVVGFKADQVVDFLGDDAKIHIAGVQSNSPSILVDKGT